MRPARKARKPASLPKSEGNAGVQAYIASMEPWQAAIAKRVDALVVKHVPGVRKAVRWHCPFYGVEGQGWFLAFAAFQHHRLQRRSAAQRRISTLAYATQEDIMKVSRGRLLYSSSIAVTIGFAIALSASTSSDAAEIKVLISEIVSVPGAELLGPLPGDLQSMTDILAGVLTAAPEPDAARALLRFLTSSAAAPAIKAAGMEPGGL